MERDRFNTLHTGLTGKRSRRHVLRDALVAAGSLGAAPWLMRPNSARAQDLATPVAVPGSAGQIGTPETVPIDHVVVIFLENRPFDHLYGLFPGANGLLSAEAHIPQTDANGVPYVTLPPVVNSWANPPAVDTHFPSDLPNKPFLIEDYVPLGDIDPSPTHRFYQHQLQVNGGRMDRYVVWSDTGGLPLGHFDTEQLPL